MAAILNFPDSAASATTRQAAGDDARVSHTPPCESSCHPADVPLAGGRHSGTSPAARSTFGVPAPVADAVDALRTMTPLDGISYEEIGVPERMADYGIGVAMATLAGNGHAHGGHATQSSGWIMLLYSPVLVNDWGSPWRCVAYAGTTAHEGEPRAMLPQLYWDMCAERLDGMFAVPGSSGGTVSVSDGTGFGLLSDPERDATACEIRASWTPVARAGERGGAGLIDAPAQVNRWGAFLRDMSCTGDCRRHG